VDLTTKPPTTSNLQIGRVERVNGPVVHVSGLKDLVRFEFIEVGEQRLPGEIIAVEENRASAQIYEYTGGLTVGEPVWASGHPLTVDLGPDLLGGIYDGLLRPLDDAPDFLVVRNATPRTTTHHVEPLVGSGDSVGPGDALAVIHREDGFDHLVLAPPGTAGFVDRIVDAGDYEPSDTIATVSGTPIALSMPWPVRHARPYVERIVDHEPFLTGQRVLDTLAPIAKGSSATVIGGFGEGKTMLLEQLAKWGDADVIIYVGCGERGNELADLIDELTHLSDPRTGRGLLERTIIIANTSNMPVMAREASIYTAVTVAEYFRDMGLHAVIIADSTSRWAEARRELASRTGAIPAEQGYPADLPSSLAAFYQRAGRVATVGGRDGTVTIVTSVSPPGGDATEPVSAHTQRFVQAVWALDRELAYARHYPAIAWSTSFSRDADAIADWHAANGDPDWATRRSRLQSLLTESTRLRGVADLVGLTALPIEERLTLLTAQLVSQAVLQQSALSDNDASCAPAKQQALAQAVLDVHDEMQTLGHAEVPASLIEAFDFGPLVRAKDTTAPRDADGVHTIASVLLASLKSMAP
jgi:V/A-type H+-transporting ATPase subunit A